MNKYTKEQFYNIQSKIFWFNNIFFNTIIKEGWTIYYAPFSDTYKEFNNIVFPNGCYMIYGDKVLQEKAHILAKEYGWIIEDDGLIIDFDINKLTRNKHLLTGSELGLL